MQEAIVFIAGRQRAVYDIAFAQTYRSDNGELLAHDIWSTPLCHPFPPRLPLPSFNRIPGTS